ncbi:MAG TPA: hypothetical protein PLH94_10320 [Fimbriimonadaceae bacterium]|nr:hypothetical protein [Fimbriimonadaceae bacterium]
MFELSPKPEWLLGDMIEVLALGIPLLALMIPIVAILTYHQRKMAEIIHLRQAEQPGASQEELERLRREVADLTQRLHAQAIELDTYQSQLRGNAPPIEQRLT